MKCTRVQMPGGGTAIICGPRQRQRKCGACPVPRSPATLLCDWKMPGGKTCDKPLCSLHGRKVADDKHLCPEHSAAYDQWLAKRKDAP